MDRSRKKADRRRRITVIAAAVVAASLVLMSSIFVGLGSAIAGEREDAIAKQEESQNKIDQLKSNLSEIDQELTDLFIQMEQTNIEVGEAQQDLITAEENFASAQRHYQQVADQLADAEALKGELEATIEDSKVREQELSAAVGSMAREMYRGDTISPFQVVVNTEDLGEISSRAAAATALSRAQSRALDDVRLGIVVTENQSQKQEAVTVRISDLKAEAEVAYNLAQDAQAEVEQRLASLESLQSTQTEAQAKWESRKGDVETQLQNANAELNEAAERLAQIELEEAKAAAANNTAGSSSASSSSTGAFLNPPIRGSYRLTSPFGWRTHPIFGAQHLHDGLDFGASCGTLQYATRVGTVYRTGSQPSAAGNYVMIDHGVVNGHSWITAYYHAEQILVSPGQQVTADTAVAKTGSTGNSTGCHLHLSLFRDGVPVDPAPYL